MSWRQPAANINAANNARLARRSSTSEGRTFGLFGNVVDSLCAEAVQEIRGVAEFRIGRFDHEKKFV
jgi:hypothetical protein